MSTGMNSTVSSGTPTTVEGTRNSARQPGEAREELGAGKLSAAEQRARLPVQRAGGEIAVAHQVIAQRRQRHGTHHRRRERLRNEAGIGISSGNGLQELQ